MATGKRETLAAVKARVMAEVDRRQAEAIELLQQMIRIASPNPPGDEREIGAFTADYLRKLDLDVQQIEPFPTRVSNVARLHGKTGKPTLLLNSHLDTVSLSSPEEWEHPMLGAEIHDGMIWGVGAKNMKSGMGAAMFTANILRRCGIELEGDLLLCQAADEMMGGFKGLGEVVGRNMLQADYGIYTETGIPSRIEIGHRGRVNLWITVKGRAAHTTEPAARKPINAVVKMAKVIDAIVGMEFTHWEPHAYLEGKPIHSVNMIEGGFSSIMIPDRCSISVDVRTLPPQTPQTVLADAQAVLTRLKAEDPELEVTAEVNYEAPYSFISADHPIVHAVQAAIVEVTGGPLPVLASPATSDTRWLVLNAGIPTCKFSFTTVGSGPNERIRATDYINMIKVYLTTTLDLLYDPK